MKIISYIKLPLYIWSIYFTSILLILSLPFLAIAITLILTDRNINTSYYETIYGGDVLIYQHLFWLFRSSRSIYINNTSIWFNIRKYNKRI